MNAIHASADEDHTLAGWWEAEVWRLIVEVGEEETLSTMRVEEEEGETENESLQ